MVCFLLNDRKVKNGTEERNQDQSYAHLGMWYTNEMVFSDCRAWVDYSIIATYLKSYI